MCWKIKILLAVSVLLVSFPVLQGQVTGLWKTIDDRDGSEKSIIEIFEKDEKLYGKVVQFLAGATYTHCDRCPGELKGKPLIGMIIIRDLTKTPNGGVNGKVMDPNNGKTYSCFIELENPDKLKLRGYIGMPALGRTQFWYRVK